MQELVPYPLRYLPNCHIVGGAVRDYLLNKPISDIDLATSMLPSDVLDLLESQGITVIPTGIEHGTVTAMVDGSAYEITTFRQDVSTDGRRATVRFSSNLADDLARRDFTINAMAMTMGGVIVDPFDGQADINAGLIRAVGDPRDRFKEDYLRILRAYRFAARFGFKVHDESLLAIMELAENVIQHVSIERIVDEFNKAFKTDAAGTFIINLLYSGLMDDILPEVQSPSLDVLDIIAPTHRWHALLRDVDPHRIIELSNRLRFPTHLRRELVVVSNFYWDALIAETDRDIRRFQANVGQYLDDVAIVCRAIGTPKRGKEVFVRRDDIEPVLMGRDLLEAGFQPGPQYSNMLDAAYNYQIDHGVTDRNELLGVAVGMIDVV